MQVPIPALGSLSPFPCVPMATGQQEEQKPWPWLAGSWQELPKPGAHRQFIPRPTQCCEGPCPSGAGAEPGSLITPVGSRASPGKVWPGRFECFRWDVGLSKPSFDNEQEQSGGAVSLLWCCRSLWVPWHYRYSHCHSRTALQCWDRSQCPSPSPAPLHTPDGLMHIPSTLPSSQVGLGSRAGFKLPRGNAAMPGKGFEEIWDPRHCWNAEPRPWCDVWSPCVRRGCG